MKTNGAPKKLYLLSNGLISYCKSTDEDIEYIRKDAIIEKACDAYCKVCGHYAHETPTHVCRHDCRYFCDFKKYIKGE